MKTIPFQKLKDEWMKDASFRMEYERLKPKYMRTIFARGDVEYAEKMIAPRLRDSA